MDRETALETLTPAYAEALRLREQGADDRDIAARLGLPIDAITNLLQLARAKLETLLALPDGDGG
ncbi:MAG TPA: sigma factor-like helix-turn-helix DNA-binding protein [Candidatus Binatia bacterium]|nr:sigma factor-like helix-turn-helix DNA-binding protein [Candidatus Binatia bacterium]